ncbi:hypothetical protein ACFQNE_02720 [Gordonia phosphorivorans]|uniref:Conjugal transfer protein TrbC n=1 Tax=Gordonia phosphorivorans TaxID=1056982 RepID=A0ABV6H5Y0_9ACTN
MTTTSTMTVLAAGGVDSINGTIQKAVSIAQTLGGSLIVLIIAGLAISMMFGAFGEGGKLRQQLGKVAIVAVGGLLLGGGALFGPMLVNVGQELPKATQNQTTNDVN